MDLNLIWFILIAVLFVGFFFLEGFDFGVGILLPFVAKDDDEKRVLINTIGPVWDGNEVWLITAGGAIFAAFPNWYATLFSGFYLALLVALTALILRGVSFEFRSAKEDKKWRKTWDNILFSTSVVLSIIWAVALANLGKGVPIDASMNYVGGFFDLFSMFTLMAGIAAFLVFVFHGAIFLSLKTDGVLVERSTKVAKHFGLYSIIAAIALFAITFIQTNLFDNVFAIIVSIIAFIALISSYVAVNKKNFKTAMILNGLTIALTVASLFIGMFPNVMISSINPNFNLTVYNAASSSNTLLLMTKVALIFVPIVLAYQGWTYWIFRKRITKNDLEY